MRPLKLEMTAFGPYPKQEIIDFNELKDKNLFLITGPTGSGKTTIFDAISFAMYGEANGDSRVAEQLRSQFADDDTLTEVNLEFILKDIKYEIHRIPRQERKKKRGDGFTEQKPKATLKIYDSKPEKVITGVTDVNNKIEEIIGINIEQFRQIMMIPQGEFRKLLTSDSKDREAVLQKLFDTKRYEVIQKNLKQKAKKLNKGISKFKQSREEAIGRVKYEEDKKLEEILNSQDINISNLVDILEENFKNNKKKLNNYESKIDLIKKEYTQELKRKNRAIGNNEKLLKKENLYTEIKNEEKKKEAFSKKEKLLKNINIAKEILPLEEKFNSRKIELNKKEGKLKNQKKKLRELEENFKKATINFKKYNSDEFKNKRDSLMEKVSDLKKHKEKFERLNILSKKLIDKKDKKNIIQEKDKKLEDEKEKIIYNIKNNTEKKEEAKDANIELSKTENKIQDLTSIINLSKKLLHELDVVNDLDNDIKKWTSKEKHKERKLEETNNQFLRTKKNFFENQAAMIAQELKEGDPCPVCGSKHHEHLAKFNDNPVTKKELEVAEIELNKIKKDYQEIKQKLTKLESKKEGSLEKISEYKKELSLKNKEEFKKDFDKSKVEQFHKNKKEKINKLKDKTNKLEELIKKIEQYEKDIKKDETKVQELEEKIEENNKRLDDINKEIISIETNINEIKKDLPENIKDKKSLDKKILENQTKLNNMDKQKEKINTEYNKQKSDIQSTESLINELNNDIEEMETLVKKEKKAFEENLENNFKTLENYEKSKKEINNLDNIKKEISNYKQNLYALNKQYNEISEETKDIKKENIEKYEETIKKLNDKEKELTDKKGDLKGLISNNRTELNKIKKINNKISKKEENYKIVGHLANIADGQNNARMTFERYVLAAFFEDILMAANQRLEDMTGGRYFLRRTDEKERANKQSGLEMKVFDNYTGEYRHVKTLSGGETFKASLSMALGLSDVVQSYAGNVRLDTMFIDEGFGTLDTESLDSAIDCLVDLQKRGRLVGIISHVSELRERIDVRLEVNSTNSGSKTKFKIL